jgi:hypothetical protein
VEPKWLALQCKFNNDQWISTAVLLDDKPRLSVLLWPLSVLFPPLFSNTALRINYDNGIFVFVVKIGYD